MNARDQSIPSENSSLNEDYQERGLRILGKLIARDLAKRHGVNEDKMSTCKTNGSPISGDDV